MRRFSALLSLFFVLCGAPLLGQTPLASARDHLAQAAAATDKGEWRRQVDLASSTLGKDNPLLHHLRDAVWPQPACAQTEEAVRAIAHGIAASDSAVSTPDTARAQSELESVLRQREFAQGRITQGLAAWLSKQIERLVTTIFRRLSGNVDPYTISMCVNALSAILITLILVLLGMLLRLALRRSAAGGDTAAAPADSQRFHEMQTADQWLRQAEEEAQRGNYRQAVRCTYLAILRRLEESGLIACSRGQTNWEVVRQLGADWRRLPLEAATRHFEWHWFADQPSGPADYDEMRQKYQEACQDPARGPIKWNVPHP